MKRFTNSSIGRGLQDPEEVKALLFSLLSCFIFLGFLTVVHRRVTSDNRRAHYRYNVPPPPVRPSQVPPVVVEEPPPPPDANSRFREVPQNFRGMDFRTRSYGNYSSSDGKGLELVLVDGHFRQDGSPSHWFDLHDVYYTDLTGDGSPEAIVMLSHLECAKACDGGKNLFYVYSLKSGILSEILRYESGSGLDGCSLKSLTVKNKRLALELFGRCPKVAGTPQDTVRRATYDVTRVEFAFNGLKLVPKNKSIFTVPDCNDVSYDVEVRISDERSPVSRTTAKPCSIPFSAARVD